MFTGLFEIIDELIDFSDHASWQNANAIIPNVNRDNT